MKSTNNCVEWENFWGFLWNLLQLLGDHKADTGKIAIRIGNLKAIDSNKVIDKAHKYLKSKNQ